MLHSLDAYFGFSSFIVTTKGTTDITVEATLWIKVCKVCFIKNGKILGHRACEFKIVMDTIWLSLEVAVLIYMLPGKVGILFPQTLDLYFKYFANWIWDSLLCFNVHSPYLSKVGHLFTIYLQNFLLTYFHRDISKYVYVTKKRESYWN